MKLIGNFMDIVRHITILHDSLFDKRCQIDEYPVQPVEGLKEGIKFHTGLSALILNKLGKIIDVKDRQGNIFHLDKESYQNYRSKYQDWFIKNKLQSGFVEGSVQKFHASLGQKKILTEAEMNEFYQQNKEAVDDILTKIGDIKMMDPKRMTKEFETAEEIALKLMGHKSLTSKELEQLLVVHDKLTNVYDEVFKDPAIEVKMLAGKVAYLEERVQFYRENKDEGVDTKTMIKQAQENIKKYKDRIDDLERVINPFDQNTQGI